MAIQKDFTMVSAGDLLITGAYHKICGIEFSTDTGARPSGDQGGGPEEEPLMATISWDTYANSGIRFTTALCLDGQQADWPIESWGDVSTKDKLLQSAYGFLKTGSLLSGGLDV
tara:strand:+ start:213 stop:554 length:342 start_codon:yes stop_codon:yes gene_type:complete